MALDVKQQNLINDLQAPIKSFRLFALEEVIKSGNSSEVLSALQEMEKSEDDPECQMLISHALSSVKEKLSGSNTPVVKIKDKNEFLDAWKSANDDGKLVLLSNLPPRLPKQLRGMGPDLIVNTTTPVIEAKIIRSFCRFWPEDKFESITKHLDSESLSLKLAALRTLVSMNPKLLVNHLPGLLSSEDPQIKALSIRALAKIDKDEALQYLQALLLSPSVSDRLAGIQNCPFLPFDMVKPVLLKYFSAENHPELLIRAGWILEMNPDVYVPFKLFEIAERSPAKKATLVKEILSEAVKLLDKSGILGDKFSAYTQKLQVWVNTRNAQRFVRKTIANIDAGHLTPELEQVIRQNIEKEHVKNVFKDAIEWPISEVVKQKLKQLLSVAAKEPVNGLKKSTLADASNQTVGAKLSTNHDECIKEITSLNINNFDSHIEEIKGFLLGDKWKEDIKIAAFHSATRLEKNGLESIAEKLISNRNILLATSAVSYLGTVDPERVFPYIGKCLKVADVEMKSAALGILKQFDYNQAISSLNAMLYSRDENQQAMALECVAQFDFALIRDELTEYMVKCRSEKLIEKGLCHFAANPARENIYSLYKVEKSQTGNIASMVASVRKKYETQVKNIESVQDEGAVENEASLKAKWIKEQEKKKSKKPAYAYRKAVAKPSAKEVAGALSEQANELVRSKGIWFGLLAAFIVSAILWVFFVPGKGIDNSKMRGGAVMAKPLTVEGVVTEIKEGVVFFKGQTGESFIISPGRDGYRLPKRGMKLRASLLPYRRTADGKYLARIRGLRMIESFSEPTKKE